MCGVAGFIDLENRLSESEREQATQSMLRYLTHRGPDSQGMTYLLDGRLRLVHTRLSILDLSDAGKQPMCSTSGLTLTYNGEIYNHRFIRQKLIDEEPNLTWHGYSDSEVLLKALDCWGIEKTLQNIEGMFAFALFEEKKQILTLVRDRFGEKPLYYLAENNFFAFSSEWKAINFSLSDHSLDEKGINYLINNACIPAPGSIFRDIKKLAPATILQVSLSRDSCLIYKQRSYWSAVDTVKKCYRSCNLNFDSTVDKLDQLLCDSVENRLEADVPLGCLLSGGIDSSLITAIAQKVSRQTVRTFTAGFNQPGFDESGYAQKISDHLGTEHTTLSIDESHLISTINTLAEKQDEPFADNSFIPTWLISECTKQHVDVVLTGDGGDELFCGYRRYFRGDRVYNFNQRIPLSIRQGLATLFNGDAIEDNSLLKRLLAFASQQKLIHIDTAERVIKYIELLKMPDRVAFYKQMNGTKHIGDYPLQSRIKTDFSTDEHLPKFNNSLDVFRLLDTLNYLPEDILVKTDRCAMAHALECRLPFLDRSIFEFCWSVPIEFHVENGQGKRLLKSLLARYVPNALWQRPKQGFAAPVGYWLKNELQDWTEQRLKFISKNQKLFNQKQINQYWQEHLSGKSDRQYHLWPCLVLSIWLEKHG